MKLQLMLGVNHPEDNDQELIKFVKAFKEFLKPFHVSVDSAITDTGSDLAWVFGK